MKRFLTLFFLLAGLAFSYHSAAQGSLAALDAKNGFRDAKLGMSITQFKGMTRYRKDENTSYYKRASDKMMLGDIPLKEITYSFYKGKLESIYVDFLPAYVNKVVETLEISLWYW